MKDKWVCVLSAGRLCPKPIYFHHTRRAICQYGITVAVALGGAKPSADAQVPPPLDHYRVYAAFGNHPLNPVSLVDQFQAQTTLLSNVGLFLVPTSKNGEGIHDPFPHLTCDGIPTGSFLTTVSVDNQFRNGNNDRWVDGVTDPADPDCASQAPAGAPLASPLGVVGVVAILIGIAAHRIRRTWQG